ncbi:MAG: MEDS domain-containing protein [Candidatus Binatus sp.]
MLEDSNILTIEEAARFLKVSKISLRRWTNTGRLRCFRVGLRGERRFAKAELEAFLAPGGANCGQSTTPTVAIDGPRPQVGLQQPSNDSHISLHYSSEEEQFRMFRPYLLKYVRLGAPILYIYDSTPRARLMSLLRSEGTDPDELTRRGVLRAVPSSEAYLRDGGFCADAMLAFVEKSVQEMLSGGKSKALITGEMSWYCSGANGVSGILDYERRLNRLADKYPQVAMICQYHIDRFDSAMTLGALCAHPVVELPDRTVRGYYDSQL